MKSLKYLFQKELVCTLIRKKLGISRHLLSTKKKKNTTEFTHIAKVLMERHRIKWNTLANLLQRSRSQNKKDMEWIAVREWKKRTFRVEMEGEREKIKLNYSSSQQIL